MQKKKGGEEVAGHTDADESNLIHPPFSHGHGGAALVGGGCGSCFFAPRFGATGLGGVGAATAAAAATGAPAGVIFLLVRLPACGELTNTTDSSSEGVGVVAAAAAAGDAGIVRDGDSGVGSAFLPVGVFGVVGAFRPLLKVVVLAAGVEWLAEKNGTGGACFRPTTVGFSPVGGGDMMATRVGGLGLGGRLLLISSDHGRPARCRKCSDQPNVPIGSFCESALLNTWGGSKSTSAAYRLCSLM